MKKCFISVVSDVVKPSLYSSRFSQYIVVGLCWLAVHHKIELELRITNSFNTFSSFRIAIMLAHCIVTYSTARVIFVFITYCHS